MKANTVILWFLPETIAGVFDNHSGTWRFISTPDDHFTDDQTIAISSIVGLLDNNNIGEVVKLGLQFFDGIEFRKED